jgi:ankyrin repeat protein
MVVSSISPRLRHLPSLPLFLPSINHRFFGTKSSQVLGDDAAGTLCRAAKQNDIAALKKLLEEGANVNAADYDKRTALHIAAAEVRSLIC